MTGAEVSAPTSPWWSVGTVRRYVGAYGLDALVDGAFFVLLGWVSAHSLGGASAVAVIAAASVLKLATLILIGGALGDRLGSATVVRGTLLLRVVLLAALAVGFLEARPAGWILLAAAALYGLVDGLHDPAIEALSTEVRGAPSAQRSLQGALTVVREVGLLVAGPAVGGLLLALSSAAAATALAVLLALTWLLVVSLGRTPPDADLAENTVPAAGLLGAAKEGWKEVWTQPHLRLMILVFLAANIALTPPVAVGVPLLAKLHTWSSLEFGLVDAGYAAGALLGGICTSRFGDRISRPIRAALISLVPTAISVGVVGWVEQWFLAAALFAVAGVSTGIGPSLLGGAIKEATSAGMQGRIQAVRASAIVAGGPIGYVAFAALSELWSTPAALSALGAFLGVVVLLALTRPAESLST